MPLILGANSVSGGYEIDNSLRFNSGSDDSLTRTFGSSGNRKTWTFSTWIKRTNLINANMNILGTDYAGNGEAYFLFKTGEQLHYGQYEGGGGSNNFSFQTNQAFRDVSAWYNILFVWDTTQSTSSDRMKLYINGTQVTSFSSANYPTQNLDGVWNSNRVHYIGDAFYGTNLDGYLSETYFIDGQALTPSSFGETDEDTGIWKPKAYTGTYGTNGFYLDFEDSANLGNDMSGNNNDFTVNNLTSIDQSTDTPTNNFCTMSPLIQFKGSGVSQTYEEGNLQVTSSSSYIDTAGTFAVDKGKWFWEFKCLSSATTNQAVGIVIASAAQNDYSFNASNQYRYQGDGNKNGTGGSSAYGASYTTNDIIGTALDCDNGTLIFYKNGVSQGTAYTGLTNILFLPILVMYAASTSLSMQINFGNPPFTIASGNADANGYGNFEYAVPSGYYALCTKNLAEFG